jgi:hypothetical protein
MEENKQAEIEYLTMIEEYKVLKNEMISNLASSHQIANLAFVGIGVLISVTPFIIQSNLPVIFLIAPLFFYALTWAQLRYTFLVLDMGDYLRRNLRPEIQRILNEIPPSKKHDFENILSWELQGKNPTRLRQSKRLKFLFLPVAGANFSIPLLASLLSVTAFLVITSSLTHSTLEVVLIAINSLALVYSAYWGFRAESLR